MMVNNDKTIKFSSVCDSGGHMVLSHSFRASTSARWHFAFAAVRICSV